MPTIPHPPLTDDDRELLRLLDRAISHQPARYWDTREWGGFFLDDLTSAATGERCEARLQFTHHGQPVALIEVRPHERTATYIREAELHYWLTLGNRKPKPYFFFAKAMDAAMGMRSRSIWERPGYDRFFRTGDLRVLRRLYQIDFLRDAQRRERDAAERLERQRQREDDDGR